jgi:hypothetical protein
MSKWRLRAVAAVGLVTVAVLTACSDSAERRSLTGPTALAPGGALAVEAEADLTSVAGTRDVPPEGVPAGETTTLTFDDITKASTKTIHDGYGRGLHWAHLSVVDGGTATVCAGCVNGYANGSVSGDYVAYIPFGGPAPAEVTAPAGWTFDFISVYLTRANDRFVQVLGYTNGELRYDQTVELSFTPRLFTFNYLGVDRLVISSRGGSAGYSPLGDTFAMDNFTYNRNLPATPR